MRAMREIDLQEYAESAPLRLSLDERGRAGSSRLWYRHCAGRRCGGPVHADPRFHRRRRGDGRAVGAHRAQDRHPAASVARLLCHRAGQAPEARVRLPRARGAARRAGARVRRRRPQGVLARAAPRLPHRGRCVACRARAHPVRRPDPPPVWHPTSGRSALRRVHGRHPPEPPRKGGRSPSRQAGTAFARSPRWHRLGSRNR